MKWCSDFVYEGIVRRLSLATHVAAFDRFTTSFSDFLTDAESVALPVGWIEGAVEYADGAQVTVPEVAGIATRNVSVSHVALVDYAGGHVLWVTTCPKVAMLKGQELKIGPWKIQVGSPM